MESLWIVSYRVFHIYWFDRFSSAWTAQIPVFHKSTLPIRLACTALIMWILFILSFYGIFLNFLLCDHVDLRKWNMAINPENIWKQNGQIMSLAEPGWDKYWPSIKCLFEKRKEHVLSQLILWKRISSRDGLPIYVLRLPMTSWKSHNLSPPVLMRGRFLDGVFCMSISMSVRVTTLWKKFKWTGMAIPFLVRVLEWVSP